MTGSAANTIGTLNSIRYRGYFYDNDLGFYLLETRYYDPETGRFINADGVVDIRGVETANLYAYCANDPVNFNDHNGDRIGAIIAGAIIGAATGALTAYAKKKNKKAILREAIVGAAFGAATSAVTGWLGNAAKLAKAAKAIKAVRTVRLARASMIAVNFAGACGQKYVNYKLAKKYTRKDGNSGNKNSSCKISQTIFKDCSYKNDIEKDQSARSYLISAVSGGFGGLYGTGINSYAGEVIAESRKITFDTVGNFGKELGVVMTSSGWSSSAELTLASLFPGE